MGKWDEAWGELLQGYSVPCDDEGVFFKILFGEREADMEEDCCEEEAFVSGELAGAMADMTIGPKEDEVAEAQTTAHELRVVEAKRKEQLKLLRAEKRRIEFAIDELKDYDD